MLENYQSSYETPIGKEEDANGEVDEAGSFTEAFSSDEEGSIGDNEDVGINKSVLKREASPGRNQGRPASPGATFAAQQMFRKVGSSKIQT